MKNRILRQWSLGLVLAVLPLANVGAQEASGPPDPAPGTDISAPAATDPSAFASSIPSDAALASAPVQAISTDRPLPPGVRLSGPAAEVIRLANSGVDQSVVLAYVNNSPNTFNLGAEEVIYLNDIGMPGNVVTAMIQHDQAVKAGQPPMPPPVPSTPAPPPAGYATDQVPSPDNSNPYAPAPDASAPPVTIVPGPVPPPDYAGESDGPPPSVASDSAFYDSLAPYGTWVNVDGYGACWQPGAVVVTPGWQPYFNCGRWVYSDCGWYWLSGYTWGWAPFHYGRWFHHNTIGWCWAPGTVWGPSWVAWRYTGAYCGWAPLPPSARFNLGVGLTFRGQAVGSTFGFGLAPRSFAFVAFGHFYDSHLPSFAVPNLQVNGFFARTTLSTAINFSNGRVINNALPPKTVAAITKTPIHRISIHEVSRTTVAEGGRLERFGAGGAALSVFRPISPQAAGSRANSIMRPAAPAHGSPHAMNTAPLILHGPSQSAQSETAAARTPASGTAWKDIPRTKTPYGSTDASYQRWQQSIQPAQKPWYLPDTASAGNHSRTQSRQGSGKPQDTESLVEEMASRRDLPAGSAASTPHQWQYSTPNNFQTPRNEYPGPSSYGARPVYPESSGSVAPRSEAIQPRAVPAPAPVYVAPASHPVVSQPAPAPSYSPPANVRYGR